MSGHTSSRVCGRRSIQRIAGIASLLLAAIGSAHLSVNACRSASAAGPASAPQQGAQPPAAEARDTAPPVETAAKAAPRRPNPWTDYQPVKPIAYPAVAAVTTGTADALQFAVLAEFQGHAAAVRQIRVAPDSRCALTRDADGQVFVWDLAERRLLGQLDTADHGKSLSIAISPDGNFALVAGEKQIVSKWDLGTLERVGALELRGRAYISAIEFTADPSLAAMIDNNRRLVFCDVAEMRQSSYNPSVQLSQDRQLQSFVKQRDVDSPPEWRMYWSDDATGLIAVNGDQVFAYERSENPRTGAAQDRPPTYRFIAAPALARLLVKEGRGSPIQDVRISDSRQGAMVAYGNGLVAGFSWPQKTKDPETGRNVQEFQRVSSIPGFATHHRALALLPGKEYLAVYGGGETLNVWPITGAESNAYVSLSQDNSGASSVAICPDGRHALSGFADGRLIQYAIPQPFEPPADSQHITELGLDFAKAWATRDFDRLETLAKSMREAPKIPLNGVPEYSTFFDWVRSPSDRTEDGWQEHLIRLEEWERAKPDSVVPKIALAFALHDYGWAARGGGFIQTVTEEGGELFTERLKEAGTYLVAAQKINPKDPALYHAGIVVGQGLGFTKDQLDRLFQAGFELAPDYFPLYTSMATCLLPRWFGQPGDIPQFLNGAMGKLPPEDGLCVYALVTGHLKAFHGSSAELELLGIDLQKADAGADLLIQRYSESNKYMNIACWRACDRRDRAHARYYFSRLGNGFDRYIWDENTFLRLRNWAMQLETPEYEEGRVLAAFYGLSSLAFSPDGKTIAVGGTERLRQVTLWDADTLKLKSVLPHPEAVYSVDFSADGKQLLTGGGDGAAQLAIWTFDAETPKLRVLECSLDELYAARLSPDGKWLAAGSKSAGALIWDMTQPGAKPKKFTPSASLPAQRVESVPLIPGMPPQQVTRNADFSVRSLAFSRDSNRLSIVIGEGLAVLNLAKGTADFMPAQIRQYAHAGSVTPDATIMGGQPYFVQRFPYDNGQPIYIDAAPLGSSVGRPPSVASLDVSSDGRLIAVALRYSDALVDLGGRPGIALLDAKLKTNRQFDLLLGHTDHISDVRISPDGKRLASVGFDGTLRLWRLPEPPPIDE